MILDMKDLGPSRRYFALSSKPPISFAPKSGSSGSEVPPFEPYEEDLPLQSGFYTFVIDTDGHFRVKWGNTRSHASFVDRKPVAAAGWFRIGRLGKLAEVNFTSYDYRISYKDHEDRVVVYAVDSFVRNPAFDVSKHAFFCFRRQLGDSFYVDTDGNPIDEAARQSKLQLLDLEGAEPARSGAYAADQVAAFLAYTPPTPPRLYPIRLDQSIIALEEDGDLGTISPGEASPRLSIDQPLIPTGKVNFVIDEEGWLIVGIRHHHILSGGGYVGGAGHLLIDDLGRVDEMQLNFSGHYRPPLTADYVRYAFAVLKGHPLLTISPDYTVKGRKFDEESFRSSLISFEPDELETGDASLDEQLERLLI
jgi:hypothetical protein